jgi:transcriptional regulator with XRE-family HTH domain
MAGEITLSRNVCQRHTVTVYRYNVAMRKYADSPGQRLRTRREELKLSVKEVAQHVGLGVSTLYEIENGRQRGSTRMHALCKHLNLRVEYVETGRLPRLLSEVSPSRGLAESRPQYTVHGMQTTPEEVEFGIEWGKLDEPARSLVREQVMLLVAEQVRRRRAKKDGKPSQPPKHQG